MSKVDSRKKLNVLFIVPTLRRAGAETQVVDLINGLDGEQFSKSLVVFERNTDQLGRLDRDSVAFYHFLRTGKLGFGMVREIARLIDDQCIDIIHCTIQISLLVGWLACVLANRKPKLVVALHTTVNVSKKFELFDRILYRWLIYQCKQVIFVCHNQADYWIKKYPALQGKERVIYNGVDGEYFQPAAFSDSGQELRRSLDIPGDTLVFLCVAGFRQEKGHRFLIEAFAQLEGMPHLLFAGDGPLRQEIETLVKEKGLVGRVHFLGNVTDVRPALAAADVSVLASTAVETFSMAMLESMAMEVPMVATDIGGLREAIVSGETGELAEAGDPVSLAAALRKVSGDRLRCSVMGSSARRRVKALFSRDQMLRKTERALVEVGCL